MNSSGNISQTLIDGVDIQALIIGRGGRNASLATAEGYIVSKKEFDLKDARGKLNPFSDISYFSGYPWSDSAINQIANNVPRFTGTVQEMSYGSDGRRLTITAIERLAVFLDFLAESGEIFADRGDGLSIFTNSGNEALLQTTIALNGAGGQIPVGSFINFGASINPRYQVTEATGSPNTTSIKLDRGLVLAITAGTPLRILIAETKTNSEEIRDTLMTAGYNGGFDATWDILGASDLALGYTMRFLVRAEMNISVRSHIATCLEAGNLTLLSRADGVLSIFRGLRYAGGSMPGRQVTRADILPPWKWTTDTSRLIAGYSLPFRNGTSVELTERIMSEDEAKKWKNKNIWTPAGMRPSSNNVSDYPYLYSSLGAARGIGDSRFDDFRRPFYIFQTSLKPFPSGQPGAPSGWNLGDEVLLSAPDGSGGRNFEPSRVWEINENETRGRYDSISFLLGNIPDGSFNLDQPQLERPIALRLFTISNGGAFTTPTVAGGAKIIIEIYDYTCQNKVSTITISRGAGIETNGETCDLATFADSAIVDGLPHYFRARATYGIYESQRTNLTRFIPGPGAVVPGQYNCEQYT